MKSYSPHLPLSPSPTLPLSPSPHLPLSPSPTLPLSHSPPLPLFIRRLWGVDREFLTIAIGCTRAIEVEAFRYLASSVSHNRDRTPGPFRNRGTLRASRSARSHWFPMLVSAVGQLFRLCLAGSSLRCRARGFFASILQIRCCSDRLQLPIWAAALRNHCELILFCLTETSKQYIFSLHSLMP